MGGWDLMTRVWRLVVPATAYVNPASPGPTISPPSPVSFQTIMADYQSIQALHKAVPPFSPYIAVGLLPYIAFFLLVSTFGLAFYFSTLPKDTIPIREVAVASTASLLGGFGVVALFCSVGVYV
ncbi:unnamed protein product [Somion occarium]|uniref:Dolichyl-diphosphooligosaccharide-protein glycosyltransferase subunit OST5 n=1 Tax=Somion occarium TaxID=3059160 RepID=A0ABP1CMH1_9APHY